MIKINLLDRKKPLKIPTIAGINVYEINVRPLIASYAIYHLVINYGLPFLEKDLAVPQRSQVALSKESKKLARELRKDKGLEKKMAAFDQQIQRLKQRETEVEQIMAQRSNPKNILAEIPKKIPKDLWIDEIIIKDKHNISLSGGAISYASLSSFIEKIRKLQYFSGNLVPKDTKTETIDYYGKKIRASVFTAEGKIVTFGEY